MECVDRFVVLRVLVAYDGHAMANRATSKSMVLVTKVYSTRVSSTSIGSIRSEPEPPPATSNAQRCRCHTVSVVTTLRKRTHVTLPAELVADIDRLVGKRGRSAFLTEVAQQEIQRQLQRKALQAAAGTWKDADHPELKHGSARWVRQMRAGVADR